MISAGKNNVGTDTCVIHRKSASHDAMLSRIAAFSEAFHNGSDPNRAN